MLAFVAVLALAASAQAYLPGMPTEYSQADGPQMIWVDRLESQDTLVPYNYYKQGLFCPPNGPIVQQSENLGQILTGARIENSPYTVTMRQEKTCEVVCVMEYSKNKVKKLEHLIKEAYHVNMVLDDLPAAAIEGQGTDYAHGYRVGLFDSQSNVAVLYNHVSLMIDYHIVDETASEEDPPARIVAFHVEPHSRAYPTVDAATIGSLSCDATQALVLSAPKKGETTQIVWTYDVYWHNNPTLAWATRLDVYLNGGGRYSEGVHLFNIVNSTLIVVFLSLMIALIIKRNVYRDLERYERKLTDAERQEQIEESGWKLVHADVFRPPTVRPMLFCVCVGTGAQLLMTSLFVLVFASVGFISPATRGLMMIAILLVFVLLGALSGYVTARLFKSFKGRQWQRATLMTAAFFPTIAFVVFFIVNLFLWGAGSSAAVPFRYMFAVIALLLCVLTPSTFVGAWAGFRAPTIENPTQTSNIPRSIPDQPWYMATPLVCVLSGLLPMGAVFVELYFLMNSLWEGNYYSWFPLLLLVVLILVITTAEITIVMIYFTLCGEDYNWWWRSFVAGGSCGGYVLLYSMMYFSSNFQHTDTYLTGLVFFSYISLISFFVSLVTGAIGFAGSFWFVRLLMGSVKVD